MRSKTSLFKRTLAALLSFVMVLGMFPALGGNIALEAEAVPVDTNNEPITDYITMPITIRDFAADGMLFEYNETGDSGVAYKNGQTGTIAVYLNEDYDITDSSAPYDYPYLWEYDTSYPNLTVTLGEYWHVVFINSDGTVNRVCKGNAIADTAIPEDGMVIFAHASAVNGAYLGNITENNKANYVFGTVATDESGATGYYLSVNKYEAVYHQADTKGFGMLYTKDMDIWPDSIHIDDDIGAIGNSFLAYNNSVTAKNYGELVEEDGDYEGFYMYAGTYTHYYPYQLFDLWNGASDKVYASQHLYNGSIRTNLMQRYLVDGKPIYTSEAVGFLAEYMKLALSAPWQNADGSYNTFFVTGDEVADGETLAERIRQQVNENFDDDADDEVKMGTYGASYAKFFNDNGKAGDGLDHYTDIETWYDAAFFLLHNTWRDSSKTDDGTDGYGKPAPEYHSLHLVAKEVDGKTTYVFNSMYEDSVYDPTTGEIYNTQTSTYEQAYTNEGEAATADGNIQPVDRFDPLGKYGTGEYLGYGIPSPDTYGDMIEASDADWNTYYDTTNYHLSLEGHAQFVYQYDADQYFTFTGDDDVYLYINGQRVLDIGGGHSIAKVGIKLNDVAQTLGLKNGGTYDFDFFYMERHGTAANFGIETNIQIADASMHTEKQGFQNGVNTGYGGPVNGDNHVGYTFTLENNGEAKIYNLTFNDPNLGVYFGYDEIRPYPVGQTERSDKYPYAIETDLYLIYYNSAGEIVEYIAPNTGLTADTLKAHLIAGLEPGEKIGIYGIKYKIDKNEWSDPDGDGTYEFINHVYTTSTNTEEITGATKTLHGVADWKVVKMQHPYEAFRVYDWVHKAVSNDPADAANLTWKAPGDNGIPASNTVTVSKEHLIEEYLIDDVNIKSLSEEQKANINIVLCTAAGNKDPYYINPNVKKDAESGGITYTSKTTGKDTVFFVFDNVPGKDELYNTLVFSYEVYTYGAVDNVYVLDYGLSVELAGNNFGFHTNDHLVLNENTHTMTTTVTGMMGLIEKKDADGNTVLDEDGNAVLVWDNVTTKAGTYGDFAFTTVDSEGKTIPASLKYTPDAIINGTDEVYAKFRIMEADAIAKGEDPSIYNSVEMVQKITTAPANVVYYEENFPGITYTSGAFGNWVQYETMKPVYDSDGKITGYEPIAGLEQSPDQNMNYGSNHTDDNGTPDDPSDDIIYAYDKDKEGVLVSKDAEGNYQVGTDEDNKSATLEWGSHDELAENELKELNDYLAIRGGDSNGTVKELVINTTKQTEAMYFTFVGTGVEIIGRTTDDAFAVINVVVQKKSGDNWVNYRMKPVITQSIGGDQYQVPIISFTGLDKAEYRVSLKVAKSAETTVERMLYIDGVRIYGPLGDDEALEYYNPEEYKAEFIEVKQLIDDSQAIFCAASSGIENEEFKLVTGGTMVEQVNGETVLKKIESHDEYLRVGPNNELYLLGGSKDFNVVCFFIKEIPDYIDGARTLQIGAHRKADSDTLEYTGSVNMIYGSLNESMKDAKAGDANFYSVDTGTEMYYDIDIDELTYDKKLGGWIVMIGTNGTTPIGYTDTLALTNIKVAGYTISSVTQAIEDAKNQGQTASTMSIFTEPIALMGAWLEAANKEPEIEELPVNENMSIEYAELIDDKVSAGNYAMATVKTNSYAQNVVVYDVQGNEVELIKCIRRRKNGAIYFDIAWEITGSRGEKQTYTIRVLDSEKNASVNTKTVAVTIV